MDSRLYDDDIFAWSEQQAAVLRRLAEVPGRLPNDLDVAHVAEEIEDVGQSQRNAAESFIRLILVHLIKLSASPRSPSARHWRGEIVNFHAELVSRLTATMHGRIDIDRLWRQARRQARESLDEGEGADAPVWGLEQSPIGLSTLAQDEMHIDRELDRLIPER